MEVKMKRAELERRMLVIASQGGKLLKNQHLIISDLYNSGGTD